MLSVGEEVLVRSVPLRWNRVQLSDPMWERRRSRVTLGVRNSVGGAGKCRSPDRRRLSWIQVSIYTRAVLKWKERS